MVVPAPLIGPEAPRRIAIVDAAEDLGGIAPNASMQEALRIAAAALTDAGYEVVREKTPGFARAFELWFEMLIPEFRKFMQADFERDGDEGIRVAMRYVLDNVPEIDEASHLRALSERTRVIRDWNLFFARTPLVLTVVCTEPPYAHGFDLESAERTMRMWREASTLMAIPVLGLPASRSRPASPTACPSACRSSARDFARTSCLRRRKRSRPNLAAHAHRSALAPSHPHEPPSERRRHFPVHRSGGQHPCADGDPNPGPGSARGLRMCAALYPFWAAHGYFAEGRQWCARMVDASAAP